MQWINKLIIIFFLLSVLNIASATNYYVDKTGNDSNIGSEASPWLTIQKGATSATAGDTVYVKNGTYSEQVIFLKSGAPGNYITFQNYSTDIVTITAPIRNYTGSTPHQGLFHIIGKSYVIIKGFQVTTAGGNARTFVTGGARTPMAIFSIQKGSHDIIVEGNILNDIDRSAIFAGYLHNGSDPYAAWNITFTYNYVYRPANWTWDELVSFDDVNRPNVSYNVLAHQGKGECIDFKNGADNGIIDHNIISNCFNPALYLNLSSAIYIDGYAEGVSNHVISNNIIRRANGVILGSEQGGLASNNKFYNNIFIDGETGFGYSLYHEPNYSVNYLNNTFINNLAYMVNISYYANSGNSSFLTAFRNNIMATDGSRGVRNELKSNNILENNSWNLGISNNNPQFLNPAIGDFHLKNTSPSINAGTLTSSPITDFDDHPRSGLPDLGPYEFVRISYPRYDIDENGTVDTNDLTSIGQHFNEVVSVPYPRYDVNMDGQVNIHDITITGQYFGENT